jgi:hypothetical protein
MKRRKSLKGRRLRRFSPQEDAVLRAEFSAYVPLEDIAAKLNRDWGTIRQRCFRLGLHRSAVVSKNLTRASEYLKQEFFSGRIKAATFIEQARAERTDAELQICEQKYQERAEARARRQEMIARILSRRDLSRNDKMRTMRDGGARLEEIAVTFGITRERVRQICEPDFYNRVQFPRAIKTLEPDERQILLRKLVRYWNALSNDLRIEFLSEVALLPADYDGKADFAKSIELAYALIRERKANGGKGWEPK